MRSAACNFIFLIAFLGGAWVARAQDSTFLQEVNVKTKATDIRHLYQVEGMKITAGKKSEVVNIEELTANKATNNARQVYGKVTGLNIFENDGSGLQLSIGGRGLDPNRTSNYNVRQNGYDISADVLGYPESYYTPPTESLKEIQLIKGSASLQYGTQFGGLLNFELKQPGGDKPLSIESRQTVGSTNFLGSYNSISGSKKKWSYFGYIQYKQGDGWRPNSRFNSFNAYFDVHYQLNEKQELGIEYTHLNYVSQQAGGLTDNMFLENPRQSNRSRNWFAVKWNLLDIEWAYQISSRTKWQTRINGLLATRDAIGFRPARISEMESKDQERDLLKGKFENITFESRLLHRYQLFHLENTVATGIRLYRGYSTSRQGDVWSGNDKNFEFANEGEILNQYSFPNYNAAFFAEQIIRISDRWNITPGIRLEYIHTRSEGYYISNIRDLRDSIISSTINHVSRSLPRSFMLGGIGSSFKPGDQSEIYGNVSQSYRSVTYNDMMIKYPSFEVDSAIRDERGWSADLGYRGKIKEVFSYDISAFYFHYNNKIGEYDAKRGSYAIRRRANVGVASVYGVESFMQWDILQLLHSSSDKWKLSIFSNLALTRSVISKSAIANVEGNRVEYVPAVNWKSGLHVGYQSFKLTYQNSYLSKQYSEVTNSETTNYTAVTGPIPAYYVMDISASWSWKWLTLEGSVNNLTNNYYFTRRATGYPGPGIIPSDGRIFYLTAGIKI